MPETPDPNTTPPCVCCGRPLYGQATRTTCHGCERRISERLTGIADYYSQLPGFLTPERTGETSTRAVPGSRIPLNLKVLNLLGPGGVSDLLGKQEDAWRDALGWQPREWRGDAAQTLPWVLHFLGVNLLWACGSYEYVDDLDRDLAQLYGESKEIVTGTKRRTLRVGCRAMYDDGTVCGASMRIDVWATAARCRTCGARYTREHWLSMYHEQTQPLAV